MTIDALLAEAARGLDGARADGGAPRRRALDGDRARPVPRPRRRHRALPTALLERDRYTGEHSAVGGRAWPRRRHRARRSTRPRSQRIARRRARSTTSARSRSPTDVLHKPGPLDDDEWELMREHPAIGERILRAIPGMGGVARIVRHEHERFDGGGYPDGLRRRRRSRSAAASSSPATRTTR